MKIGIDVQSTQGNKTGLGVYTENLIRALTNGKNSPRHEFSLYRMESDESLSTPQRLWWENVEIPRRSAKDRLDLLHIPAFAPPIRKPCRLVVTVHDLIGMIFPNQVGWPSRFYWGKWLPWAVKRADKIIADSENTKKDLIRLLSVPHDKIRVIYPSGHEGFRPKEAGACLEKVQRNFKIRERYFLFVGTIEPRKNLTKTLQAFAQFKSQSGSGRNDQLLIVGSRQFAHGKYLKELLREKALSPEDVVLTGYVPHDSLNDLYSGALAFLFPSLYEGFGIPVLEAMASGTPVIASNRSSVPEVAGKAAYFIDPDNVQEMAAAMKIMTENQGLRSELIEKGKERIQHFSWSRMADQILEVYESAGNP